MKYGFVFGKWRMQFIFLCMYLLHIQYSNRTFIVSVLPTFQMKPINQVGFNDNVNIWDTWKFMTLIMADRDTAMSVCDYVGLFLLSALPVAAQIQQTLQISEQHQSSPPVSNTSCGSRKLTLLYCPVLSLRSNFEQRDISGPSESDKSKKLYSESGNNSSSSSASKDKIISLI